MSASQRIRLMDSVDVAIALDCAYGCLWSLIILGVLTVLVNVAERGQR